MTQCAKGATIVRSAKNWHRPPSFFVLVFHKLAEYHNIYMCINSGDVAAKSCEFRSSNSRVYEGRIWNFLKCWTHPVVRPTCARATDKITNGQPHYIKIKVYFQLVQTCYCLLVCRAGYKLCSEINFIFSSTSDGLHRWGAVSRNTARLLKPMHAQMPKMPETMPETAPYPWGTWAPI